MSKRIAIVLCLVILLLFSSNFGFAQPPDKWGIGGRISYYAPDEFTAEGDTWDPDAGVLLEGNITYFVNNWFSLELGAGYTKSDVDVKDGETGLSIDFGELEQIPILLTGRLHYWFSNSKITLYAGGGVGYYINDFELSGLLQAAFPGSTLDADNSFGFHVNGGVAFFVTDNVALDLDLKYVWNEADFTQTDPGDPPETAEFDLDAIVVGFSIKYFF
jgi:outer membrane protein